MTTFDLILIGFGNVARRLVTLLDEAAPALRDEEGIATRIVAVRTRSHGATFDRDGVDVRDLLARAKRGSPLGADRSGPSEFLESALRACRDAARARRLIVVELTTLDVASGQPAIDHVRAALRGGAHVVTANKGPAAFAYADLAAAANLADRCFRFESAALDGVPLFNLRRCALPALTVTAFRGVVNSTTNYMLTAMERGETFDAALAAMQRAGIAESDPSLDIDGWDAAAKTAVLANVMLGGLLTPQTVDREGLTGATAERARAAKRAGNRLKLVASAERDGTVVRGRVRLMELRANDLLAQLEGQQNAVVLNTDRLGEIAVVQRSGGLTQTAYGVLADIVSVARQVTTTTNGRARRRLLPGARRDRSPSRPGRRSR